MSYSWTSNLLCLSAALSLLSFVTVARKQIKHDQTGQTDQTVLEIRCLRCLLTGCCKTRHPQTFLSPSWRWTTAPGSCAGLWGDQQHRQQAWNLDDLGISHRQNMANVWWRWMWLCSASPNSYGSIAMFIPFLGMNIHKNQLSWCELQGLSGFWPRSK